MISAKALAALFLLPFLALPSMAKPESLQALSAPSAAVKLLGSSTMHGWEANAGAISISASVRAGGASLLDAVQSGGLAKLDFAVTVDSLKSTEGGGMDSNLHKDLESDKFPVITFSLAGYAFSGATVTAQGTLTIHGVSRPVTLSAQVSAKGEALEVKGSAPVLMTDYGVKPPVMMFGAVKVADKVAVDYDFTLAK